MKKIEIPDNVIGIDLLHLQRKKKNQTCALSKNFKTMGWQAFEMIIVNGDKIAKSGRMSVL